LYVQVIESDHAFTGGLWLGVGRVNLLYQQHTSCRCRCADHTLPQGWGRVAPPLHNTMLQVTAVHCDLSLVYSTQTGTAAGCVSGMPSAGLCGSLTQGKQGNTNSLRPGVAYQIQGAANASGKNPAQTKSKRVSTCADCSSMGILSHLRPQALHCQY
jgi:hypothetical protein